MGRKSMKSKSRRTRKTARQRRIAEEELKKQLQSGLREQRMKVYGPSSSSSESSAQNMPARDRHLRIVWPKGWKRRDGTLRRNVNKADKKAYRQAQSALNTIKKREEHAKMYNLELVAESKKKAAQKARVKYEQELEDWYVSKTRAAIERGYKKQFLEEHPTLDSYDFHEYMKNYSDSGLLEDLGSMPEPPS